MSNLSSKVIITNLSISAWSGRKFDKQLSNELAQNHNADRDMFNATKRLVDKAALKDIQKQDGLIRTTHYKYTLPFKDNGDRILPSKLFPKYKAEMNKLTDERESLVRDFCADYQLLIDKAKQQLNGTFNPADYPSPGAIASKFGVNISYMPLPDRDLQDMRLAGIASPDVDDIRKQITAELNQRHVEATKDLYERVKDQLTRMVETLSQKDKIFRDSLIGNLTDLIELLPLMNYTNDPKLVKMENELKTLVTDPNVLRNNETVRQDIADKAAKVKALFF